MKHTKKPLPMEAPQSLVNKLKSYAKEHLTDDERTTLNAVFGVFNYSMVHKEEALKEQPGFLKVVTNAFEHMGKSFDISANTTIETGETTKHVDVDVLLRPSEKEF